MPEKKLRRSKSTEEAALTGLRAALERYPTMSRGAFARAAGIDSNTLFKWLRGELPQSRYIEIIHDFIEGRLVPRELGPNEWTLEPVAARQADYLLALGEIAAGSATLWVSGTRITIDRSATVNEKSHPELDPGYNVGKDGVMSDPQAPVFASMTGFKLYPQEIALLEQLRDKLGTTKTDVIRRALKTLGRAEGLVR